MFAIIAAKHFRNCRVARRMTPSVAIFRELVAGCHCVTPHPQQILENLAYQDMEMTQKSVYSYIHINPLK